MNNETVISKLEAQFPQCWFKEIDGTVTSGEGGMVDGMEAFNHSGWCDDPSEVVWTMGVNNDLIDFVEDLGMYWECQDPGTYKLYEN